MGDVYCKRNRYIELTAKELDEYLRYSYCEHYDENDVFRIYMDNEGLHTEVWNKQYGQWMTVQDSDKLDYEDYQSLRKAIKDKKK